MILTRHLSVANPAMALRVLHLVCNVVLQADFLEQRLNFIRRK